MNRKYLLPLSLLLLTLILAACGGGEDFSAPDQPNLSLQAGELSDGGLRTVACWPKGEDNVSCEFTTDADSPNPSTALAVQGGQPMTVVIANPEGVTEPNRVVITSRETDTNGAPLFTKQIDPTQTTEFVLQLPSGRYLLDVTAYYADIEGTDATVSNVFAVDVGQAVAGDVTPEATAAITPETTEAPTEALTPEVTAEITAEATPESTEAVTETVEPTPEETDDAAISGGSQTETPAATATSEVVEPTEVVTEPVITDEEASPSPEPTEIATEAATPEPITPATTEAVDTPTETATEVTAPPTPTATPTVPPPTPTNTIPPTATVAVTPTSPVSPTNTSVFDVDAPPAVTVRAAGRNYQPVGYDYCRRNAANELVCVKQTSNTTGSTSIRAARNAALNVQIGGPRPTSVEISYLSNDTFQPVTTETRVGDNVVLLNLGINAGSYVLSVKVTWSAISVTYFFQIQVLQ